MVIKRDNDYRNSINVHWKARITLGRYKPFLSKTLSIAERQLQIESEIDIKVGKEVKVEIFAYHNGVKKLLTLIGAIRSSVLRSTGTSYGINVVILKISSNNHGFIKGFIVDKNKQPRNK